MGTNTRSMSTDNLNNNMNQQEEPQETRSCFPSRWRVPADQQLLVKSGEQQHIYNGPAVRLLSTPTSSTGRDEDKSSQLATTYLSLLCF